MTRIFAMGRALTLLLPVCAFLVLPQPGLAAVQLNEILADPVSDWSGDGLIDFKNDEWIEIANDGDTAVDLSDYWLSDSVGEPVLRYRFEGTLAAGAAFHVTGALAVAWQADTGNGSAGLSLSNSGGEVALFRDGPDESVLVDSVEYGAYQVDDNRALGRADGVSGAWILFDGLNLYHGNQVPGSTGCLPSPGEPNSCEVVGAEDESLSAVKGRYSGN